MEIKIAPYDLLNNFLTGLVFIGGCAFVFPARVLSLLRSEIIKNLGTGPEILITVAAFAAAYEFGLIINRCGSIIIEDFFKRCGLIPFNNNYALFNERKKQYPIMGMLSREYALSRTGVALFLVLLGLALVGRKWTMAMASALIAVIYYLSCRKHASKIVALMENAESAKSQKLVNKNEARNTR